MITVSLNLFAMWKQEPRNRTRVHATAQAEPGPFGTVMKTYIRRPGLMRLLTVIGFGAADVLLEPYGGQVLGMSMAQWFWSGQAQSL